SASWRALSRGCGATSPSRGTRWPPGAPVRRRGWRWPCTSSGRSRRGEPVRVRDRAGHPDLSPGRGQPRDARHGPGRSADLDVVCPARGRLFARLAGGGGMPALPGPRTAVHVDAVVHGGGDPVTDQAPDQQALTPTSRWLALVADWMPPEEGPAGTAERILLLLHYGIDWTDGWVSRYRKTYWQHILPERVISATYGS